MSVGVPERVDWTDVGYGTPLSGEVCVTYIVISGSLVQSVSCALTAALHGVLVSVANGVGLSTVRG